MLWLKPRPASAVLTVAVRSRQLRTRPCWSPAQTRCCAPESTQTTRTQLRFWRCIAWCAKFEARCRIKARFERVILDAQNSICKAIEDIDGCKFREDAWSRPSGGGGISRVLQVPLHSHLWRGCGVVGELWHRAQAVELACNLRSHRHCNLAAPVPRTQSLRAD
jgi:hypothetical protein